MIFFSGTPKSWHQRLWHETEWWGIRIWNCGDHRMLPICLWIFCFDISNGYNFILFVGRRIRHDWHFIFLKKMLIHFFYVFNTRENLFCVLSIDDILLLWGGNCIIFSLWGDIVWSHFTFWQQEWCGFLSSTDTMKLHIPGCQIALTFAWLIIFLWFKENIFFP